MKITFMKQIIHLICTVAFDIDKQGDTFILYSRKVDKMKLFCNSIYFVINSYSVSTIEATTSKETKTAHGDFFWNVIKRKHA